MVRKSARDDASSGRLMGIVGHCPRCGAPIYGHAISSQTPPPINYTCSCVALAQVGKTLADTTFTK